MSRNNKSYQMNNTCKNKYENVLQDFYSNSIKQYAVII